MIGIDYKYKGMRNMRHINFSQKKAEDDVKA